MNIFGSKCLSELAGLKTAKLRNHVWEMWSFKRWDKYFLRQPPTVSVKTSFSDVRLLVCGGKGGWHSEILMEISKPYSCSGLSLPYYRIHCRLRGKIVLDDKHTKRW